MIACKLAQRRSIIEGESISDTCSTRSEVLRLKAVWRNGRVPKEVLNT